MGEQMAEFVGPSGEKVRGRSDFVALYADICSQDARRMTEWIAELRAAGVKAAHPDDGWVNRSRNAVHLEYPNFNDGIAVGDLIALGRPNKSRIVRVSAIEAPWRLDPEHRYYLFETVEVGSDSPSWWRRIFSLSPREAQP